MMRLPVLLAMVLWLAAGCGFTPIHGHTGDYDIEVATYLAATELQARSGVLGQQLKNAMEDRFDPDSSGSLYNKAFRLEFDVKQNRQAGVIERDGAIMRFNIILTSDYRLIDAETREVLDTGTIHRTASYFNAPEKFASYIAEKDAIQRALIEMGEDYKMRLSSYFAREFKLGPRGR